MEWNYGIIFVQTNSFLFVYLIFFSFLLPVAFFSSNVILGQVFIFRKTLRLVSKYEMAVWVDNSLCPL